MFPIVNLRVKCKGAGVVTAGYDQGDTENTVGVSYG